MLEKVISGGQTGVDQAGLAAAHLAKIPTGGYVPKGWKTQRSVTHPMLLDLDTEKTERQVLEEVFGLQEHRSEAYPGRTYANVCYSDGTLRIARYFHSSGELCTLKAITKYERPHLDIKASQIFHTDDAASSVELVKKWLVTHEIKTLNVGDTQTH